MSQVFFPVIDSDFQNKSSSNLSRSQVIQSLVHVLELPHINARLDMPISSNLEGFL
jgi:hypothetical protein